MGQEKRESGLLSAQTHRETNKSGTIFFFLRKEKNKGTRTKARKRQGRE